MLSRENDNTNSINSANYEEFFILYLDNELSMEQRKIVDEFLLAHPELQIEFNLIMSTRLPVEKINFNKEALMSENMQLSAAEEDLLLYIDQELPAERKKIIALELASNRDYWMQHQAFVQTKLDASEKIPHPNKKELYRSTQRSVIFKSWMRIAAAFILIASSSILYLYKPLLNNNTAYVTPDLDPSQNKNLVPGAADPAQKRGRFPVIVKANNDKGNDASAIASEEIVKKNKKQDPALIKNSNHANAPVNDNLMAYNEAPERIKNIDPDDPALASVRQVNPVSISPLHSELINNPIVTSSSNTPYNNEMAIQTKPEQKGSFKGFLRKASRLIEKRTGIDPVNDNGELLIGMVAIKVK